MIPLILGTIGGYLLGNSTVSRYDGGGLVNSIKLESFYRKTGRVYLGEYEKKRGERVSGMPQLKVFEDGDLRDSFSFDKKPTMKMIDNKVKELISKNTRIDKIVLRVRKYEKDESPDNLIWEDLIVYKS